MCTHSSGGLIKVHPGTFPLPRLSICSQQNHLPSSKKLSRSRESEKKLPVEKKRGRKRRKREGGKRRQGKKEKRKNRKLEGRTGVSQKSTNHTNIGRRKAASGSSSYEVFPKLKLLTETASRKRGIFGIANGGKRRDDQPGGF